jgi:hypothetical protein
LDAVIRLPTSEGSVQIDASDESWCPCTLVQGEVSRYLGAASLDYITRHLWDSLLVEMIPEDIPYSGEVYGQKVRWVLSLSEEHSSLYMASTDSCRLLFWQDSRANLIALMHLSQEGVAIWRRRLAVSG